MGEIVNLRLARKRAARDRADRQAAANRALHGLGKAERVIEAAERKLREAALEGHRRERSGEPE